MADGIIADQGVEDWLNDLIAGPVFSGMVLHLYQSNTTPTDSSVLGNFTEATFTGYAAPALSGWTAAVVTAHVGATVATTITFTLTAGSQDIYGCYLTNAAGTRLEAAVRDPAAPVAMTTTVNTYQVSVTVTLQSEF